MCAYAKKSQRDTDLWLQSFGRPRAHFLTHFVCSDISDAPFFEASCMLEIDTAETSDGTVPPPAAELASTSVPCATPHPSLSFAIVMFSASFVALTTSLSFHTFISSAAHSRPFVLCSSAATRRVGRVKVGGDGLCQFCG